AGSRRLVWSVAFAAALLIGAGVSLGRIRDRLFPQHIASGIQSLAVLPLEDLSGGAAQEYFADAMTDELITEIAKLRPIRVISRTSVMLYKRPRKPLPAIARELDVDAVVEGTILRSGQKLRVTAQLIRTRDDAHIWAENYERDLDDVIRLQAEI